jgi:hypothetical protein
MDLFVDDGGDDYLDDDDPTAGGGWMSSGSCDDDADSGGGGGGSERGFSFAAPPPRQREEKGESDAGDADATDAAQDAATVLDRLKAAAQKAPSVNDGDDEDDEEEEEEKEKGGARPDGFVDHNGNRREYDAPAPPKEDLNWGLLMSVLVGWTDDGSAGVANAEDVDGKEPMLFFPMPLDEDFHDEETQTVFREAEELLRPLAISRDDGGRPMPWTEDVERELRDRGIKLCDSMVIEVKAVNPPRRFGVRFFHLTFRFFCMVVLSGAFAPEETKTFSLENKRVVRYYHLAMSTEKAILEHCV